MALNGKLIEIMRKKTNKENCWAQKISWALKFSQGAKFSKKIPRPSLFAGR
jgi:hypothetical protein